MLPPPPSPPPILSPSLHSQPPYHFPQPPSSMKKQSMVMKSLSNFNQSTLYSSEDFEAMMHQQHSLFSSFPETLMQRQQQLSAGFRYFLPNRIVEGVLQRGPCCGMVALHLALAQMLLAREKRDASDIDDDNRNDDTGNSNVGKNDNRSDNDGRNDNENYKDVNNCRDVNIDHDDIVSVEAMIDAAKLMNFTTFGEMFSCENMAALASSFLPRSTHVSVQRFEEEEEEGDENNVECERIKAHFQSGGLILIPYDKDVNFSPCMSGGKKAHWALLLGFVEVSFEKLTDEEEEEGGEEERMNDKAKSSTVHTRRFVAARHGKALRIAFWKLGNLLKSNCQLKDYDWAKLEKDAGPSKPIVPEGGLEEGLKGKMVFIGGSSVDCP